MNNSSGDGFHYFYEDGQLVIVNPGSGNLCDPGAMTAWMKARDQNNAAQRKAERATAKAELRRTEAADKAALGEVFGALATLIRQRRAEANRPARKTAVLKRHKRRRIKGD